MKHNLKISISKDNQIGGVLACRSVTLRERVIRLFLGEKQRVMVLVPGNSVQELSICKIDEGEEENE